MIRTQIYLTEEQAREIKLRSKQLQTPEAQLIRELLASGLKLKAQERDTQSSGESLLELVAIGKKHKASGPGDLSTSLDDYLYGEKQ